MSILPASIEAKGKHRGSYPHQTPGTGHYFGERIFAVHLLLVMGHALQIVQKFCLELHLSLITLLCT